MDKNDLSNNEVLNSNIKNQFLESIGYKKSVNNTYMKDEEKMIIYIELISGLIVKIDKVNFTAYRLNMEINKWQEDSVLYTEYEYGELEGKEIEMNENYEYGEPYIIGGKKI